MRGPGGSRRAGAGAVGGRAREAAARRQALRLIYQRLVEEYGTPSLRERRPPLEEVVFTVLSQNTTDTNRDRAWANLWRRFSSWDEIARAPAAQVAEAIEVGGLHRVKARRTLDLLRQVKQERGAYDLDHLRGLELEEARRELARFKGLGPKSVNCVLLFSLGLPAFPVDTHVHRVLRRVGVLESRDLGKANREIQEEVPDPIAYPLHMNLIRHGREVCSARNPACWKCCIEDLCGYEDKNLEPR